MRRNRVLIRNVQARRHLEIFLVTAVAAVLGIRYYLYLTGYPQIGGDTLHIAHMLWGGALMLAAMVLLLAFLGQRLARVAALLGGAGFGVFIDEIGKFITKDNDYFFRPAIGIIYAIFALLYILFVVLGRQRQLSSEEAQLNALNQLEEAVLKDMDPQEKVRVIELLKQADPVSPVTRHLQTFVTTTETVSRRQPGRIARAATALRRGYYWLWRRRGSNVAVQTFFIIEVVLFVAGVAYSVFNDLDSVRTFFMGQADYGQSLVIGQLASAAVAAVLALIGVSRLVVSRLQALGWFRRSVLVNLFLTEFFYFSRVEFGALGSFAFNVLLLITIEFALHQERAERQSQN